MSDDYALIVAETNELLDVKAFDDRPPDPIGKGWKWIPVQYSLNPEFDVMTEKLSDVIITVDIDGDVVTKSRNVVQLSDEEKDALQEAHRLGQLSQTDQDISFLRVIDDLVDVLFIKGMIEIEHIPSGMLEKLNQRRILRGQEPYA